MRTARGVRTFPHCIVPLVSYGGRRRNCCAAPAHSMFAGKTGWELPWQRAVDIDTEEDWKFAEVMFELTHLRNARIA